MKTISKALANLEFVNIIRENHADTEAGQSILLKYSTILLNIPTSCGLVNNFVKEASLIKDDNGLTSIVEMVQNYINNNNISWQLSTVCESINNDTHAYNYLNRTAAKQVEKLLESDELEVVKYIKAGALKNVMFCESIRNVVKSVYAKMPEVVEQDTLTYVNPISVVETINNATYFEVCGYIYKIEEGKIEEVLPNKVSKDFITVATLLESNLSKREDDAIIVNYNNKEYKVSESNKCSAKINNIEKEYSTDEFVKFGKMMESINRITASEKSVLEGVTKLSENYDRICEMDNVKVVTTDKQSFILIESGNMLYGKSLTSNWTVNDNILEAVKFIENITKLNISKMYADKIEHELEEHIKNDKDDIKRTLEESEMETRKNRIIVLTEKFKNDPVKLAVLSKIAANLFE